MADIAPPRQPDSRDAPSTVEPDQGGGALIDEARRHARWRRRGVAVAAIVTAVVGVAAITAALIAGGAETPTSESPSIDADAEVPALGLADGAPVELIAAWAKFRVGWIRIYADGRVLKVSGNDIIEQSLSDGGLIVVRSGQVSAHDVFVSRDPAFDWMWADERLRPYAPAAYAVCYWVQRDPTGYFPPADEYVGRLAPAAQALMREAELDEFLIDDAYGMSDWLPPTVDCFRLSPVELAAFMELDATPPAAPSDWWVLPVLPDGTLTIWGG